MSSHLNLDSRYAETRQKILEEAYKIVVDQGLDQLSMRSIAAAVKSSPANLYEYFTNKDEIVYELYTKVMSELASHLYAVNRQLPQADYLEQIGVAYLDFVQQHSVLFRLHGHYDIGQGVGPHGLVSVPKQEELYPLANRTKQLFDVLQSAIQRHYTLDHQAIDSSKLVWPDRIIAYWSMLHGYAILMWLSVRPEYTPNKWRTLFQQFFSAT